MNTSVRVVVAGGETGVSVRYGTQLADIPVGGVQTFTLLDGKSEPLVITRPGGNPVVVTPPVDTVTRGAYDSLREENADLRAELDAIKAAVEHSNGR